MSDTADDIGFRGRQVLNKSKTDPLRQRMRRFVDEQQEKDLKQLRSRISTGADLSAVVKEDREERL